MMLTSKPTQHHPSQALRWTFTVLSPHKGKRAPMQNIYFMLHVYKGLRRWEALTSVSPLCCPKHHPPGR